MNKFARKFILLTVAVVTVAMLAQGLQPAKAAAVTVNWFVGLGTGTQAPQLDAQKKWVADFNAAHPDINLVLTIDASNQQAPADLQTLIASGQSPDIVGPVGVSGSNAFGNQWLDLTPLIAKTKFDTKQFDPAVLATYADPKSGLTALPFAVYPGLLYYNKDLFDQAGLKYPPSNYGDKYSLDGKDVDWSYDTAAIVATRLTFDAAGNDATSSKFDPTKIVQYGFVHQYGTIRSEFETFGGAPVIDPATGKVKIADAWRAEAQWIWNGVWKSHFIPSSSASNSDLLKPSEFASGKVAMGRTMLWYTCCLGDAKFKWDLGVQPSYNGTYYSPMDADTLRISKDTKNPDAAFTVLTAMVTADGAPLLQVYGAYPALPAIQKSYIDAQKAKYPSVTHWELVPLALSKAVSPHHESYYPGFNKGQVRFNDFRSLLYGDTGSTIDVNKELDKLQSDLQSIVDQAGQPASAATMAATAAK